MLVDAFRSKIFPYVVQVAVIFFVLSVAQYGYGLYRDPNWQKFFDKFKAAIFGYAVVTGAFTIVGFIDQIMQQM